MMVGVSSVSSVAASYTPSSNGGNVRQYASNGTGNANSSAIVDNLNAPKGSAVLLEYVPSTLGAWAMAAIELIPYNSVGFVA